MPHAQQEVRKQSAIHVKLAVFSVQLASVSLPAMITNSRILEPVNVKPAMLTAMNAQLEMIRQHVQPALAITT